MTLRCLTVPKNSFSKVSALFAILVGKRVERCENFQASFLEIYNESIRDLLCSPAQLEGKKFNIVQGENGLMSVGDLITVPVLGVDDIDTLMRTAEKHKTVKGTDMNARSSRSHTVFQLRIRACRELKGRPKELLHGSLNLVDLAGSERLDKSGATGDRLKETQVSLSLSGSP